MMFRGFVVLLVGVTFISLASGHLTEQSIIQRLSTKVIAPFQASLTQYNGLLSKLWAQLQSYDPESVIPLEIDNSVKSHSDNFVKNLHESSENCKALQTDTVTLVEQLTEGISAGQREIDRQNGLVANANVLVQTSQNAVSLASTALNNANRNLATHQESLRKAEDRYNRAKNHCFGKRRKKRSWFSNIFREIYRGICRGIGFLTGEIHHKEHRVQFAQYQVNQAQAHLNTKHTELNITKHVAKHALAYTKRTLTELEQRKLILHYKLSAAQHRKASLIATNSKMMKTVGFLDGIKAQGDAISIPMELGFILDIENVVTPLKDISADLQKLGVAGVGGFVPSISPANILQMKTIINKINAKID